MSQSALLDQLETDIRTLLEQVRAGFPANQPSLAAQRSAMDAWSVGECFAHVNAYCDIYFPRIELAIHKAKARQWKSAGEMGSNWLGRRNIRRADPANGKVFKTRKRFNFHGKPIREYEIKAFLINCEMLLRILRLAREVDLNKASVKPVRFSFFRWRLGNLLEYLVLHAQRHTRQALQAKA